MAVVTTWTVAAAGLVGYLMGSIPIGWVLVRVRRPGFDLRSWGSGNVGTSNIYRNVDAGLAALVGPAQFLQGLLPVVATRALGFPSWVVGLVALCAVIGNGWPVWLGFNGGRGIAVATGAVAAMSLVGLATLLGCYAAGALLRQIAVGVVSGFVLLPLVGLVAIGGGEALVGVGLLILILLRRLEGVLADMHRSPRPWSVVTRRLTLDQRPGRPLVGRREH